MSHHHSHIPLSQLLPDEKTEAAIAIRRTVRIGCLVNIVLMSLKLTAGYLGHSDALVADGFHAFNDVAADLIMLLFIGVSYRPANASYNYGYGKFETFSSFLMCSFLIVVSVVIGVDAIDTIIGYAHGEELEQPDIWTFIVILFAMACKEGLYRFYSGVGKRVDSKALQANAWHHRSDALASIATLVGVTFSHFFGPAFRILDPVASLVIAFFILVPAVRMFRPVFFELMEKSLPVPQMDKAREIIRGVPGVVNLRSLRARRVGHHYIFDAQISVMPGTSVEQGEVITEAIRQALTSAFCPHIFLSVTTAAAH